MNDEDQINEDEFPEKSKSQIKREFIELQRLGEQLVALKPTQQKQFPFTPSLLDALDEYTRISNRTAQKRHIRRIGKLLADEDVDGIRDRLERLDGSHPDEKRKLQLLEQWRERLITEGDAALSELMETHPELDRNHLRQLIRAANREIQASKSTTSARKIFQYLKGLENW